MDGYVKIHICNHMYTVYMCHVDQKCEPEKGRLTSKQLALS